MKIESANTIALRKILIKIGVKPVQETANELFYLSPFSKEPKYGLVIDTSKNTWHDHNLQRGGDAVTFVCLYLESIGLSHDVADALRWLSAMFNKEPLIDQVIVPDYSDYTRKFEVDGVMPLTCSLLIDYVESRGIPRNIASLYLKEATVINTELDIPFTAVSFRNEVGGYELRNFFFKGATPPGGITFIRGQIPKPDKFHVFHSIFDFLSVLTKLKGKPFDDDVIILNSLSNLRDAAAYIRHYGYRRAYLWLDNDVAGKKAVKSFAKFFAKEPDLKCLLMNKAYEGFKDVNACHKHRRDKNKGLRWKS